MTWCLARPPASAMLPNRARATIRPTRPNRACLFPCSCAPPSLLSLFSCDVLISRKGTPVNRQKRPTGAGTNGVSKGMNQLVLFETLDGGDAGGAAGGREAGEPGRDDQQRHGGGDRAAVGRRRLEQDGLEQVRARAARRPARSPRRRSRARDPAPSQPASAAGCAPSARRIASSRRRSFTVQASSP